MKYGWKKIGSALTISAILASTSALFTADATTLSRQYTKYVYATGATSTYTLSMDETTTANTRALIDGEDRVYETRAENDGIVRLSCGGTGFIIDDHTIATAAHCLHNANGFLTSITVELYNENGSPTGTTFTAVEAHIPNGRITHVANGTHNTEAGIAFDYGLITVAEDLSGYTQFSLSCAYDVSEIADVSLYVTGVPQYTEPDGVRVYNTENLIYSDSGILDSRSTDSGAVLFFDIDASGGQSGAPVYAIEKFNMGTTDYYSYDVFAIHHGGRTDDYNCGARVNEYLLQFYNNNPNISY